MARKIEIQVVGSTGSFDRSMDKAESRLKKVGKAAKVGLAIGIGAGIVALKSSVGAAMDAEKAEMRLGQAFDSVKASAKARRQAQESVNKVSRKAALDDEDLSDVLARLTRSTGSVKEATDGMALSAEIARGRNVSLEQASKAVEKAYLGNEKALRRLGVVVPDVDTAYAAVKQRIYALQDQLETAEGPQKKAIEAAIENEKAQLKSAKALDKAATAQDAIKKAQEQFGGSSEKFGETAAGAHERFQVAVENLQEAIGAFLLPTLTNLITKGVALGETLQQHPRLLRAITIGLGALAAAMVAATAAQAALNLAVLANPYVAATIAVIAFVGAIVLLSRRIGELKTAAALLIATITPLGAAMFVAYQLSSKLKDGVDAVAGEVKGWAEWLGNHQFLIPFIAQFRVLVKVLEKVKDFFSWLIDNAGKIGGVFSAIGGAVGKVKDIGDPNKAQLLGGGGGPNPRLVSFGKAAQRMGYQVGEHPAFGGVNPVHAHYGAPDHYHGGALDINADNFPGGEGAALDRLRGIINQWFGSGRLSPWGPGVLWRTQGHYDHLHISAHDKGGVVPGPIGMPRLALVHGGETVLPTHKAGYGGNTYVLNAPHYVGSKQELFRAWQDEAAKFKRRGGSL